MPGVIDGEVYYGGGGTSIKNAQAKRQLGVYDWFQGALLEGNTENALRAVKHMDSRFAPVAERMAYEYGNLGGITPETRAQLQSFTQPKASGREDATAQKNFILYPELTKRLKTLGEGIPTVTGGDGSRQVQLYGKPGDMSVSDFMRYQAFNQALQYVDPSTKASTQQYLARENPFLFRGYANVASATPEQVQEFSPEQQRERLTRAAEGLDYSKLYANLPATAQQQVGASGQGEGQSAARWLQDYLKTAAAGIGGTRAQKQFSAERLSTLDKEAAGKGELSNWATLAQNLVNPVQQRRMGSELVGQGRAVNQPFGAQYNRAGFLRNVGAT